MSDPIGPSTDTGPNDPGFAPGPPAGMLCGFAAPSLKRFLSFRLPAIPLKPPIPPPFKVPVAFSCPLNNPLRVGSTLPKGGGRVGYLPHDPDDDYDNVGSDTAPTP